MPAHEGEALGVTCQARMIDQLSFGNDANASREPELPTRALTCTPKPLPTRNPDSKPTRRNPVGAGAFHLSRFQASHMTVE